MSRIGIFFAPQNKRSRLVAESMHVGMRSLGVPHDFLSSLHAHGIGKYDVTIHYGLAQGLRQIFHEQRRKRKAIYIDLGYWGRRKRTRYDGFHKIALNARHPTEYFQRREHSPDRFRSFNLTMRPWRKSGRHILVAGMSAKAAAEEGYQPHQWERDTIAALRQLTDRPIIYRPKPNWTGAKPLPGSEFGRDQPLADALTNCHAVVTRHSNVGVDAILRGIPCIASHGVASAMGGWNLDQIEDPPMPDGREQWAADIAWTQWSLDEMREGAAYRYLADEGLI